MNWQDWIEHWHRRIDQFLLGASLSWTLVPYSIRYNAEIERLLAMMLNGQMLGLPMFPPTGTLRLLPYLMPNILSWRRMTIFDRALEGADLRHIGH